MVAESYANLRKLSAREGEPLEDILKRAATHLEDFPEEAVVQVRLRATTSTGESWGVRSLRISAQDRVVQSETVDTPDLEIITTQDVFDRLAGGSYSPVQAFCDGNMRVRGDIELGKRLLAHLAGSGTQIDC